MYNNLGLSYADNQEATMAIIYYKKALKVFRTDESLFKEKILLVLNNLMKIYLRNHDFSKLITIFKESFDFRKKYEIYDDDTVSIEFATRAEAYIILGNYDKAIKFLLEGIKFHYQLKVLKRNDFHLAHYHYHLTWLYLLKEDFQNTIIHLNLGIQILETMNLHRSDYLLDMYEFALKFYETRKLQVEAEKVKNKIKAFYQL